MGLRVWKLYRRWHDAGDPPGLAVEEQLLVRREGRSSEAPPQAFAQHDGVLLARDLPIGGDSADHWRYAKQPKDIDRDDGTGHEFRFLETREPERVVEVHREILKLVGLRFPRLIVPIRGAPLGRLLGRHAHEGEVRRVRVWQRA